MRALALALLVAACAPASRDPSVAMTSLAGFDAARFAGGWRVVAALGAVPCGATVLDYRIAGEGLELLADCASGPARERARGTGPGRFAVTLAGARAEHWVLWADEGYRSAVIGTPSGRFALILDRGRAIPADRLRAARAVLDWNGYDVAQLRMIGR